MEEIITKNLEEAKVLKLFKKMYEDYSDLEAKSKLRNIIANSTNKNNTIEQIVIRRYNEELNELQIERLLELIKAFLIKSDYRKSIPYEKRIDLLKIQDNHCALCGITIDESAHADHIVPFKYVGDELKDNIQMLCSNCNLKKNASIDYQIRFLLGLV